MADENSISHPDRWRELADLLGLPPEDPACPAPPKKVETPAPVAAAPPAPPPAEELIAETETRHAVPETQALHESEPEAEPISPQGAVSDQMAPPPSEEEDRPRGRRGRGRRGRGKRGGEDDDRGRRGGRRRRPSKPDEEPLEDTADEPIAEDDEIPPGPPPEDDEPEEELDLTNWNVPSWSELIASLYRPDR